MRSKEKLRSRLPSDYRSVSVAKLRTGAGSAATAADLIVVVDLEARPTFVSSASREVLGYSPEKLLGVPGLSLVHEDDLPLAADALVAAGSGSLVVVEGVRIAHASGSYVPLEVIGLPLFGSSGEVESILAVFRPPRLTATETDGASETIYKELVENLPVGLFRSTPEGKIVTANEAFIRMFGYPDREAVLATSALDLWADPSNRQNHVHKLNHEGEVRNLQFLAKRSDGTTFWARLNVRAVEGQDGTPSHYEGQIEDVTALKVTQEALRESENKYRQLVEEIPAVLYVAEPGQHGKWRYVSPQIKDVLGFTPQEWLSDSELWDRCLHPEDAQRVIQSEEELWASVEAGTRSPDEPFEMEYRMLRSDGRMVWVRDQARAFPQPQGPPVLRGLLSDITELKRAEALLEKRARELQRSYQAVETLERTDRITGLPNRQALMQLLEQALARSADNQSRVAVLFIDVDRFTVINDTIGHDGGDSLLVDLSRRLEEAVLQGDVLARLGGDEFVVVLERVESDNQPVRLAQQISASLAKPFVISDRTVDVSASIGIAVSSATARTATDLLRHAGAALHQAKEAGLGKWSVFDPGTSSRVLETESLLGSLRSASPEEFELHYQPIVDIQTERTVGYEALARWRHPERGLLPPATFLDLAEETGMIVEIGDYIMQQACKDALVLLPPVGPEGTVSVNLSARQLGDPALPEQLLQHIYGSTLEPHQICVEITETASLRRADVAVDSLRRLRSAGVHIAVDDFGIGYGSLMYLRMFPIDLVKIDRTFVKGLGRHVEDVAIVSAVINMARSLGMVPVAEGVETPLQREALRRAGCKLAQGYLWGRPVPLTGPPPHDP